LTAPQGAPNNRLFRVNWKGLAAPVLFLFMLAPANRIYALSCPSPAFEFEQKSDAFLQPLNGYDSFESITDVDLSAGCGGEVFSFKLDPWVRNYAPYSVGGDAQGDHAFFDLKEGWVEVATDNFDIRVGDQVLSWGSADGVNPTDVWNSSDLIDPFSAAKLPAQIIKLAIHPLALEHFIWEFVASPEFRPHRLPIDTYDSAGSSRAVSPTDSRWLIQSPRLASIAGVTVPVTYEVTGSNKPNDWQLGTRLRLMRLSKWDLSFSYSQTTYQMPAIKTQVHGTFAPGLPVLISLNPNFYRVGTAGFDAAGSIGEVGVRAEASFRDAISPATSGARSQVTWATLGMDRSFFFKKIELYLNAMFVFEDGSSVTSDPYALSVPNFEPWDRDLVLNGEIRFSQKTKAGLRSVSSFLNNDGWLHPYASSQLTDSFKVELAGDFFIGSQFGFFGQYADNNRITSDLTFNF
jgi:hypothetical protein